MVWRGPSRAQTAGPVGAVGLRSTAANPHRSAYGHSGTESNTRTPTALTPTYRISHTSTASSLARRTQKEHRDPAQTAPDTTPTRGRQARGWIRGLAKAWQGTRPTLPHLLHSLPPPTPPPRHPPPPARNSQNNHLSSSADAIIPHPMARHSRHQKLARARCARSARRSCPTARPVSARTASTL